MCILPQNTISVGLHSQGEGGKGGGGEKTKEVWRKMGGRQEEGEDAQQLLAFRSHIKYRIKA